MLITCIYYAKSKSKVIIQQLLINGMSVMTRLPGRFLATEDAYFKVVTRRRVLS